MRTVLITIALLVCMASESVAQPQSFKTEELKRVATTLKLEHLDTLKLGYSTILKDNRQIVIRKDDNGRVEHIGIRLFHNDFRQRDNHAVLEFVESGLLCNTFKLTRNKLKYADAKFLKGGWGALLSLTDSASFSISKIDNKVYQLIWKNGGREMVNMLIPIKYDLLLSTPRKKLEHNFMRDLKTHKPKPQSTDCDIDVAGLRAVKDLTDTLYTLPGKSYILPTVTNTTYYKQQGRQDYVPVIDAQYPVQTVANTLLLNCSGIPEAKLSITMIASDKRNEMLVVTVRQFMEFAKSQGCTAYFSFEEIKDGKFWGALFLYNKETGYDHILSLECDVKDIATNQLVFNSKAYLFTPTTNVKDLYNDIKTNQPK